MTTRSASLTPIGEVAKVETDAVTLSLSKDEVGALPSGRVRRWLV